MSNKFWLYVQAITFIMVVLGVFLATLNWIDHKLDQRYSLNTVLVYEPCEEYEPSDEEVESWMKTQELFKARAVQIETNKNQKKNA